MENKLKIPLPLPQDKLNSMPQEERKYRNFDDYRKSKSQNSVTPIDATINGRTLNREEEKESSSFEDSLNDEDNSNEDK